MTEHAVLTASMMDPTEQSFIQKNIALSDMFAQDTQRLKKSKSQMSKPPQEIVSQTIQFKEINESALQGILNCKIKSMILPLMADHMLRETLFYVYILTIKFYFVNKNTPKGCEKLSSNFSSNEAHLSFVCKAITAVNRTIVARLKWNFTCAATFGTCSFK